MVRLSLAVVADDVARRSSGLGFEPVDRSEALAFNPKRLVCPVDAERHLATRKEAGWTDRTEHEGIWTKQVHPGDWRTVVEAERTFKAIADGIRADKGLEPVSLVNEQSRG